MQTFHITEKNFKEEVLQANLPVLVDFYADWCGPCQMLKPVLEEIAMESNTIKIVKVNVDESPELASEFGIYSIPTLIVFKQGKAVDKFVGFQSKENILKRINTSL